MKILKIASPDGKYPIHYTETGRLFQYVDCLRCLGPRVTNPKFHHETCVSTYLYIDEPGYAGKENPFISEDTAREMLKAAAHESRDVYKIWFNKQFFNGGAEMNLACVRNAVKIHVDELTKLLGFSIPENTIYPESIGQPLGGFYTRLHLICLETLAIAQAPHLAPKLAGIIARMPTGDETADGAGVAVDESSMMRKDFVAAMNLPDSIRLITINEIGRAHV